MINVQTSEQTFATREGGGEGESKASRPPAFFLYCTKLAEAELPEGTMLDIMGHVREESGRKLVDMLA